MPKEYPRSNRVAERIRRELSPMLAEYMSDPRIGLASITEVQVSTELSQAKIYVSAIGASGSDRTAADSAAEALNERAPMMRHRLSQQLSMRYTPNIRFVPDHSQADADHISKLIDQAVPKDAPQQDDEEPDRGA